VNSTQKTLSRRRRQRGVAIIEFAIAGVACVTLMICLVQMGIAMWNHHSLGYAVHETNRYVSTHGRSCLTGGNGCGIYVSDVVSKLESYAVGIPPSNINMTLTSASGNTVINCNPITVCSSGSYTSTQWPPTSNQDNWVGQYVKLTASTTLNSMIVALWYGWSGERISSVTLKTTSNVKIVF
jgi:Flp pilus assembly protein TadG